MDIEFINILCDRCGRPIRVRRPITQKDRTCMDCKKEIAETNKHYWEEHKSEACHGYDS